MMIKEVYSTFSFISYFIILWYSQRMTNKHHTLTVHNSQ